MGQYLATDPQSKAHYRLDDACRKGNISEVKEILSEYPILLNKPLPKSALSPMYIITQYNHLDLMSFLLSLSDLNINLAEENWTPLHICASENKLDMIKLLLTHPNINPNVQCDESGDTPLHIASYFGHREILETLLAQGNIDPNLRNHDNSSVEDVCCRLLTEEDEHLRGIMIRLVQMNLFNEIDRYKFEKVKNLSKNCRQIVSNVKQFWLKKPSRNDNNP